MSADARPSPTMLRVVCALGDTKRVTYVAVDADTTAGAAASTARASFVAAGMPNAPSPDVVSCSLVVEVGRARVRSLDYSGGVGAVRGELSMALDPSWTLLPYIQQQSPNSSDGGTAVAPWSVVAYLVFFCRAPSPGGGKVVVTAPAQFAAPPLPDGRLLGHSQLSSSSSSSPHATDPSRSGVGGITQLMPQRLQAFAEAQRPCSFTE